MLGRVVAGTIATVALVCASIAWAGWIYLHTIGDPHRTEQIATAVLHDSAARQEISTVLAGQIVDRTGLPADTTPTVASAVETALGDSRISDNLIDAFGSEHARALGVDDPRPTSIDTAALVAAVREHLGESAPTIATLLDTLTADVEVPQLTLPDLHTDAAGRFRSIADTTTTSLAILAVTMLVLSIVIGDRRQIVRRYGTWAVFSGIGWFAGPFLVAAIAKMFASDLDNTIDVVRKAVQGPVIVGSIILVATGAVAIVAWLMPIWPSAYADGGDPYRQQPQRAWTPRPVARRQRAAEAASAAGGSAPAGAMASGANVPSNAARAFGPVDTFQWSGQAPPTPAYAQPSTSAPQSYPSHQQTADPWAATIPEPVDADPWSVYFDQNGR